LSETNFDDSQMSTHPNSSQLNVTHVSSSQLSVDHASSPQLSVTHIPSPQLSVTQASSPQLTASRASSPQLTVSHAPSQVDVTSISEPPSTHPPEIKLHVQETVHVIFKSDQNELQTKIDGIVHVYAKEPNDTEMILFMTGQVANMVQSSSCVVEHQEDAALIRISPIYWSIHIGIALKMIYY
jgi:hypothetical protein